MIVTKENITTLRPGCQLTAPDGTRWTIVRFCHPDIYCPVPYLDLVRENGTMKYEAYEYIYGWQIVERK